jgi:serine/threonine protein kinase
VAIKILNFHYSEIGKRETLCLQLVQSFPEAPHASIVRLHAAFDFMGHFCLALELCQAGSLQAFIAPSHDAAPGQTSSDIFWCHRNHPRANRGGVRAHVSAAVWTPASPPPSPPHLALAASPASLPEVREVALQLVKALLMLHSHDLIHADVKPENVLLSSSSAPLAGSPPSLTGSSVRLTDLGNSIKSREVKLYREDYEIQTLSYRAPEVLVGGCVGRAFDQKIDMWSLGVLLVELYLGRPLFRSRSKMLAVKHILAVLGEPARALALPSP